MLEKNMNTLNMYREVYTPSHGYYNFFVQGCKAQSDDQELSDNPYFYPEQYEERKAWIAGFITGKYNTDSSLD